MTYDDWKTESPEDARERMDALARRRLERAMWEEEHEDYLREMQVERRDRDLDAYQTWPAA